MRILLQVLIYACILSAHQAAAQIAITGLEDFDFGTITPTTERVRQRARICVNADPPGPFQIVGTGSGTNGDFHLLSGAGDAIRFDVIVQNRGRQRLQPGVPTGGLMARAPRRNGGCQPPFTHIIVAVNTADIQAAPGGRYQGNLQLMVVPE